LDVPHFYIYTFFINLCNASKSQSQAKIVQEGLAQGLYPILTALDSNEYSMHYKLRVLTN